MLVALVLVVFGVNDAEAEPIWESFTSGEVYCLEISPDGSYIVVGTFESKSGDNTSQSYPQILFFERDSKLPLWNMTTKGRVSDIEISANGEYFVAVTGADNFDDETSAYGGQIFLFEKNSSTPVITYNAENGIFFRQVSISKEGNYLAAIGGQHLYFLSTNSSEPIWSYNNSNGRWFSSVDISADGSHIIAVEGNEPGLAGGDGMFLFAKDNNTPIRNYTIDCMKGQSNSMGCLSSASFSPSWKDGKYFLAVTSGSDPLEEATIPRPTISLLKNDNTTPIWSVELEGLELFDFEISDNGKYIGAVVQTESTTGQEGRFYLLNPYSGEEVWNYSSSTFRPLSLDFDSKGDSIVLGGYFYDGDVGQSGVYFFSNFSNKPIWSYKFAQGGPVPVSITANGDYIIAGLGDVGYGGGVALLTNLTSSIDSNEDKVVEDIEEEEVVEDIEEEIFLSSISLTTSLISIGLLAIFRRN